MLNLQLAEVSLKDLQQLQNISRQTFFETFSEMNSAENMSKYLDNAFSKTKLTEELKIPESEFYFAMNDDQIIGYLKLNFGNSQTELKDDSAMEIERIYVLKEYHGNNVGQFLYDNAIQIAKSKKVKYVWLGVWMENHRALRFYRKNGFTEFDTHKFRLGDEEQTDYLMKLEL